MPSSTSASEALRFARRAVLFVALVLGVLQAVRHWGPPAAPSDYMSSTVLKNERLRAIGSPKAVLVGGSNLCFGVDSERLSEALCMPVANMGLTAALGFRFVAEEALAGVGPGDLVVVSLEQGTYQTPDPAPDALATVVDYRPEAMALVPLRRRPRVVASLWIQHLQTLRDHLWERLATGTWPAYQDRRFLPNGDLVSHLDEPQRPEMPDPARDRAVTDTLVISPAFWALAADLDARARARGATVAFTFSAMARCIYNAGVQAALKAELRGHGLTVVGDPARYVFADSLFYDSWYHLRRAGRAERTERLIADLCAAFPERCCTTPRPAEGALEDS